jgi:protein TonB
MFDSVLRPGQLPHRRLGSGTVIAIALHAGVVVAAIGISLRPPDALKKDTEVKFVARPKPPPPPPPPPAPKSVRPKPKPVEHRTVLKQAIVAPTVIPEEKPPEKEPVPEAPSDDGEAGGEVGGVAGGIQGGVVDSTDVAAPAVPPPRIQLEDTQVRLSKVSGPGIQYTQQALDHEVQGQMIIKCIVLVDGKVQNCRVLKSLPFMDKAVVQAVEQWRFEPYRVNGKAVEVDYTLKIRLEMPE